MKKRWFLCESAALFAADQLLKSYVEQNMDKGEEKQLNSRIALRRFSNKGMFLNLLADKPETVRVLSAAAAGIVTVFQAVVLFRKKGFWKKQGASLMAAGAWSNTFDRFARGHVVDYAGWKCSHKKISSITYNLGDFFIAAGAGILSVAALFGRSE